MILPVFVRHRIVGYNWMVAALVGIGFMSFALWAHHMFTTGLAAIILSFFAAASMADRHPRRGADLRLAGHDLGRADRCGDTQLLFVVGFLVIFVIGGITGVMVAAPPFDMQAHDSHFVVAHLHYVLIGGVAFPIFAGVYYWFPKFTGKLLERSPRQVELLAAVHRRQRDVLPDALRRPARHAAARATPTTRRPGGASTT